VEATTFKSAYEDARSEASQYLAPREWVSRLILSLRFLALTLALLLSFLDPLHTDVIVPITHMALAAIAYNVILVLLARYVGWLRQTLNVLVLDTLFTTAAVYLTGGYHSGFFILYFFIIIGAAFYLNLVATTIVAFILGLIYVGACFLNPAGIWTANAAFILAGKVVLLLLVALLCALLLEQLRREHRETESERALSGRLSAPNDLFLQLSASLELEPTLQTVVDASRHLLQADITVILLRRDDTSGLHLAASSGLEKEDLWEELPLDQELLERILHAPTPYVLEDPADEPASIRRLLQMGAIASLAVVALVLDDQTMGILCAGGRTRVTFAEDDLIFLKALAQEAALAIRNARLYERERQQVERLQTLEALQASTALPPFFPPWSCGQELLVDGGIAADLPVRIALARGATEVYALHLVDAPPQGKQIHGLLRIVEQSINHVLSRQLEAELQESAGTDGVPLHYIPLTGFYGLPLWDLSQAAELIEEGRRQTEAYLRASQAAARTERPRSLGRDLKARLKTAARRLQGNPARKRGGLDEKMNPHLGTFGVRS